MAARIEPILTVDDLLLLPDDSNRYELIEGELFASRAPGITHQRTVGNLLYIFRRYLEKNPIGEVISGPGIVFDIHNSVIPDLVYISRERSAIAKDTHLTEAPDLIVEVLSPGKENIERDRKMKWQVYGKRGLREYWIVDPEMRSVEIYRRWARGLRLVATLTTADILTTPLLPGFSCRVQEIFAF